ncbi:Proteasome subunit beta type-4 [Nosema bombycis CQ1]|uniref:Proteasome subunit beta type-4 n=1 Tax=Nosema bombycis (strain CQ1 / CVCC 102059) TaxID=578461 RepID=R0KT61_NOSB1|nr:Proteasome subunit beta type-4 [Nosema bombycis CQ1]|eukprot:EOB13397.1 Proteasome subunit beta type-4 [Nosema bombycis CQ1]
MRNFVISSGYISFKFKNGIVIACDTQGSYGSLAKYNDIRRLIKLGSNTLCCFSGEVSDTQSLINRLKMIIEEDNQEITPSGFHRITQRILYTARSKMEPFNTNVVIGGIEGNNDFILSNVNHLGNSYSSNSISSGLGNFIALPFLRSVSLENLEREDAIKIAEESLRIMCYRSTRNSNRIQVGIVDENGVNISNPYLLETKWEHGIQLGEEIIQ